MQPTKIAAISSSEGQVLSIAGGTYRIVISGQQTNGSFAVIEMTVPPGAGPALHNHPNFEESFYVLEGEVTFQSEMGKYIAQKDAFIAIPKGGLIHGFKNNSTQAARLLCTVIPAGLDDFFIELSKILPSHIPFEALQDIETKNKIKELMEKYGQKIFPSNYFERIEL